LSVSINVKTPSKGHLAKVLRALADWVEVVGNRYVSVTMTLTFEGEPEPEPEKPEE